MRHELKIWPQYFARVEDGSKTFEVRVNDRGYQPGDEVCLHEWDPTEREKTDYSVGGFPMGHYTEPRGYTGNSLEFRIGYVLPIDAERVVFSLLPLQPPREPQEGT